MATTSAGPALKDPQANLASSQSTSNIYVESKNNPVSNMDPGAKNDQGSIPNRGPSPNQAPAPNPRASAGLGEGMISNGAVQYPNQEGIGPHSPYGSSSNGYLTILATTRSHTAMMLPGDGTSVNGGNAFDKAPVSMASSYAVLGFSSVALSNHPSKPSSIGGYQIEIASTNDVVIAGITLSSGEPGVTISGTLMSLGSDGLIIGLSTYALSPPSPISALPLIGGHHIQKASSGGVNIAGTTLLPGSPATTISGTLVSVASSGGLVVIGSGTYTIPAGSAIITVGGQILTANSAGDFVIGSQTLVLGAAGVTVSGIAMSLATGGGQQ